jgi:hypothetical protein
LAVRMIDHWCITLVDTVRVIITHSVMANQNVSHSYFLSVISDEILK